MVDPLLRTRLELPRVGPGLVQRARLDKLLANGAFCRLVSVSAPAGYGKTTLLSDWFARGHLPVAWLSLDSSDSDLKRFLTSLTAAIETAFPDAQQATRDLLQLPQMPVHEHIVAALINDLAQFQPDFALVLDDYHLIHERNVQEIMSALIRRLPRNVHLVIATRVDPPLSLLTRLRAQGQVVEIRANDLSFTDDEAKVFLEKQLGGKVPDQVSATLVQQTEGWIAGLQLAVISMRNHPDPVAFAKAFKGKTNRHVRDYLTAEALSKQPRVVREFLLRTSILNRFCAPLCDVLMQNSAGVNMTDTSASDSQAILRRVERSNLFLIPLDEERRWYRYHHLFGELLRNKLTIQIGHEGVTRMHRRAGAWLAANGYIEEALGHLLAAGDQDGAAELVEQNLHKDINREDWRPLEGWLKLLPAELIERRPGLLIARAWILHFQWRLVLVPPILNQAEQLLTEAETINEKKAQALRGNIDALWSEIFFFSKDDTHSMESARRALAYLPESHTFARGIATGFLSFALQATGQTTAARRLLDQKLEQIGDVVNESSIGLMISTMLVLQIAGEHRELARLGSHFYSLAVQNDNRAVQSWACFLAGAACYELNDLDQAAEYFAHGIELRYFGHIASVNQCYIGLALTYQARGMSDKANETAAAQYEFDAMLQQQVQLVADRAFQARLHLLQGAVESAAHWAHLAEHAQFMATWHLLEIPALARATILLAEGTPASLQQAAEEAQQLWQDALGRNSRRGQAKVLALQALIYDAQGSHEQALTTLKQCVALTRPGGAIRTYVDMGPRMATLLEQLRKKGVAREYLDHVLAAFPAPAKADKPPRHASVHQEEYLVEPLTRRETEVLSLLAQHLSNKEIAQALFISELTVKSHTGAIYDKLGVKGRLAAIRRAIELGLIVSA